MRCRSANRASIFLKASACHMGIIHSSLWIGYGNQTSYFLQFVRLHDIDENLAQNRATIDSVGNTKVRPERPLAIADKRRERMHFVYHDAPTVLAQQRVLL